MNPKNIDRAGKGFLLLVSTAIVAASKKYGPTILKGTSKLLTKIVLKK